MPTFHSSHRKYHCEVRVRSTSKNVTESAVLSSRRHDLKIQLSRKEKAARLSR